MYVYRYIYICIYVPQAYAMSRRWRTASPHQTPASGAAAALGTPHPQWPWRTQHQSHQLQYYSHGLTCATIHKSPQDLSSATARSGNAGKDRRHGLNPWPIMARRCRRQMKKRRRRSSRTGRPRKGLRKLKCSNLGRKDMRGSCNRGRLTTRSSGGPGRSLRGRAP